LTQKTENFILLIPDKLLRDRKISTDITLLDTPGKKFGEQRQNSVSGSGFIPEFEVEFLNLTEGEFPNPHMTDIGADMIFPKGIIGSDGMLFKVNVDVLLKKLVHTGINSQVNSILFAVNS
jgi:hypothetical protein